MSLDIPEKEYTWSEFIDYIKNDEKFCYLKILSYFSKYTSWTEELFNLTSVLRKSGIRVINMGEINKLIFLYFDRLTKQEKNVDFYAFLDAKSQLLILITSVRTQEIEETVDRFIRKTPGFYYLPITSSSFNLLSHYLRDKYTDTRCVNFTAKHSPKFKLKGKNRPDMERTIIYYGEDGFETLDEARETYGVIPKNMTYRIPNIGEFDISGNGKYSLAMQVEPPSETRKTLFEIFNYVTSDILKRRKIIDDSKYELIPYKTREKTFEIPEAIPWILTFNESLDDDQIELLKNNFDEFKFTLYNDIKVEGNSFSLSGMIFDEIKNNIFMVHIDNQKIVVAPYTGNSIDSFLRFYEMVSDFDPNIRLSG